MIEDIERAAAADARHRQNSARLAHAFARYETIGLGTAHFEDPVRFDVTFTERPFIATGHTIDVDEVAEILGTDSSSNEVLLPQVTTYVVEWDRDERGFYVGAWAAASVDYPVGTILPDNAEIRVEHHLTFTAIALKDVPVDLSNGR